MARATRCALLLLLFPALVARADRVDCCDSPCVRRRPLPLARLVSLKPKGMARFRYAPTADGCDYDDTSLNVSTGLTCIKDVSNCQTCVVSEVTYGVSCKSCCAKKRETCDDDDDVLVWWIVGMIAALFVFVGCSGLICCVETRRRRDGITVAEAYTVTNVMAMAHVTPAAPAASGAFPPPPGGGIEAVAVPARPATVGMPVPEGYCEDDLPMESATAAVVVGSEDPMELGGPVSRSSLLPS